MNARSGKLKDDAADTKQAGIPMSDVLDRCSHELVHLVWLLDRLQTHIRPLIQEAAARDANILHQMQSFDHIGQIAAGLADFLAALALEVPCTWCADPSVPARNVTLADLSSRLGFNDEEKNACATAWGECELF